MKEKGRAMLSGDDLSAFAERFLDSKATIKSTQPMGHFCR